MITLTPNETLAVAAGLFGIAFFFAVVLLMGSKRHQPEEPKMHPGGPAYAEPPVYDTRAALQRRMNLAEQGRCPITGEMGITSSQRQIPRHLEKAYGEYRDAEIDSRVAVLKNYRPGDTWWRPEAQVEPEKAIPVEGTIFDRIKRGRE